jgi:RNA polymerase sigma factor (sigma-70 family)
VWNMIRNPAAAEAIVEESVLHAVQHFRGDRGASIGTLVLHTARNRVLDWMKHQKVKERHLERRGHGNTRSAFAEALTREALELFDREVKRLKKRDRQVILMRVVDQMGFEEISQKLRLTVENARLIFWRARTQLAEWLGYMRAL